MKLLKCHFTCMCQSVYHIQKSFLVSRNSPGIRLLNNVVMNFLPGVHDNRSYLNLYGLPFEGVLAMSIIWLELASEVCGFIPGKAIHVGNDVGLPVPFIDIFVKIVFFGVEWIENVPDDIANLF